MLPRQYPTMILQGNEQRQRADNQDPMSNDSILDVREGQADGRQHPRHEFDESSMSETAAQKPALPEAIQGGIDEDEQEQS